VGDGDDGAWRYIADGVGYIKNGCARPSALYVFCYFLKNRGLTPRLFPGLTYLVIMINF